MKTVELWIDFSCPYSYMGDIMLQRAIADLGVGEDTQVVYRAYELAPKAPAYSEETMQQKFMREHDWTAEEAQAQMERITRMADRLGLQMHLATVKSCSTFDAHRLMKYVAAHGTQAQTVTMAETLFYANFTDNLMLSDRTVLADLAQNVGFDRSEVLAMLTGDLYAAEVRADEAEADKRNLEYIPYFLFEDGKVLQGVVSIGALKSALKN